MKVYYFDIMGRAEAIRMLLTYKKVDFEDVRLTKEQFGEMKAAGKFEFGQVPALELDDGTMLVQTVSILRYLAAEYDMEAEGAIAEYKINSIFEHSRSDFFQKCVLPTMFAPTEEAKEAAAKTLFTTHLPAYYKTIEGYLDGKKYVAGDKMTWVDIYLSHFFLNHTFNDANPKSGPFKDFFESNAGPNLKKWVE